MADEAERSLKVSASPTAVWSVLGDITQMPSWSEDLVSIELLSGDGRSPGSRFRGNNRQAQREWSMTCVIDRYEAERLLEFHTEDKSGDARTRWWYRLDADGETTVVTEGFVRLKKLGAIRRFAERKLIGDRAAYNERNIDASLQRLAKRVTSEATVTDTSL